MKTKSNPYARFYGLIRKLPYATKEDLIWQYSHTVTNSLSEFYEKMPDRYAEMISDMQQMVDGMEGHDDKKTDEDDRAVEDKKRRLRHIILTKLAARGITVINWNYDKVNAAIQGYTHTDKTMKTMSLEELQNLSKQVHKIADWYDKKQEKVNHQTLCN